MSLTRYTREELIEILNELGTTELATATSRYECATIAETGKSLFHLNLAERLSNGKVYRTRIKDFRDKSEDVTIGYADVGALASTTVYAKGATQNGNAV